MATPYQEIYSVFLQKISDYNLANFTEEDLEEILKKYLRSAVVRFKNCRKDLFKRDDVTQVFDEDLTDEEIDILASLMVLEWLNPQINNLELLRQRLSYKDFQMYSQAQHLKELRDLKKDIKIEVNQYMARYSYSPDILSQIKTSKDE